MRCFIKNNDDYPEQRNEPLASNSSAGIRDTYMLSDGLRAMDELL